MGSRKKNSQSYCTIVVDHDSLFVCLFSGFEFCFFYFILIPWLLFTIQIFFLLLYSVCMSWFGRYLQFVLTFFPVFWNHWNFFFVLFSRQHLSCFICVCWILARNFVHFVSLFIFVVVFFYFILSQFRNQPIYFSKHAIHFDLLILNWNAFSVVFCFGCTRFLFLSSLSSLTSSKICLLSNRKTVGRWWQKWKFFFSVHHS